MLSYTDGWRSPDTRLAISTAIYKRGERGAENHNIIGHTTCYQFNQKVIVKYYCNRADHCTCHWPEYSIYKVSVFTRAACMNKLCVFPDPQYLNTHLVC